MLTLKDKTILISGASSGIGQACAILASKLDARVLLLGRNVQRLEDTLSRMSPGKHSIIAQDITSYALIADQIAGALEANDGKIHGLIHSAGAELTKPFAITTPADYRELMEVNFIAGIELCRIASKKKYLPLSGASYVFISSVMADLGSIGLSAYCASKAAIKSTVKTMALELASKKIRINSVHPGCVETSMLIQMFADMTNDESERLKQMHPLGLGKPEDIANLCIFLLSDLATWMTGANLNIDGGYSIH